MENALIARNQEKELFNKLVGLGRVESDEEFQPYLVSGIFRDGKTTSFGIYVFHNHPYNPNKPKRRAEYFAFDKFGMKPIDYVD